MSVNVAFFITPHGFGHASRATGLMQAMQKRIPDVRFYVFSTIPSWFFEESRVPVTVLPTLCDVGVVQKTPFIEDFEATLQQLDQLLPFRTETLDRISKQLHENHIDLVICDISALGILAAKQAGIPSVLIENFTWNWIYESFLADTPQFAKFCEILEDIYPQANLHIQTQPLCEKTAGAYQITSPIARQPFQFRQETRQKLNITESQPLVLLSMGGIQEEYAAAEKLRKYSEYTFIIPNGKTDSQHSGNLIFLPHHSDFYHPDLIEASDFMIGKAGYSTIAEVFHTGIPFGFISRARSRETQPLADFVTVQIPSIEITEEQYRNDTWLALLPQIFSLQPKKHAVQNGAYDVVEILQSQHFL